MKRIVAIILALFLYLFLIPHIAYASDDFSTSYDIRYDVAGSGSTHVNFVIGITNRTNDKFAPSYALDLGFPDMTNVKASENGAPLTPNVTKTDTGNRVEVKFIKPALGVQNTTKFVISFDTTDITRQQGSIWEVDIPGISKPSEFSDFIVHVTTPQAFGIPVYTKPYQAYTGQLTFTKDQLGTSGVSLAFGNTQYYKFKLTYHIQNKNLFPVQTDIALPPTTNYQEVTIDSMEPKPYNVLLDRDGNWLAKYSLLPSEKKDIVVYGKVQVSLTPKKQALSETDRAEYLKEKPYWEVSSPKIKELATRLGTPEAIYQYVVKTLSYDISRVTDSKTRVGALYLLDNPKSAVCLEFTDLFVALSRAAGIPAREVDGFANTQNSQTRPVSLVKDILHAWPEYYDDTQSTWIMVDPTWGNTTGGIDYFHALDFDHVAFVVKGLNSSYPVPAGGYKTSTSQNTKDVDVSYTSEFVKPLQKLEFTSDLPPKALSGLPISGSVTVRNIGSTMMDSEQIIIHADSLTPANQTVHFASIPPFGFGTVNFSFRQTPFLTNKAAVVTMHFGDDTTTHRIQISPFFLSARIVQGGIIGISTIIILIITAITWRVLFSRRK